jgi:hypothetical protein
MLLWGCPVPAILHSANPVSAFKEINEALRANGLWSFPVEGKQPLIAWKSLQDRPPTDTELEFLYSVYGNAPAAGIPTGPATGIIVIDADNPDAIAWLEQLGMPATWTVQTRKGRHYYFRWPIGCEIHNSVGKFYPGVDVRGLGGYVVGAGSGTYRYVAGRSPADAALSEVPAWLLTALLGLEEKKKPTTPPSPPKPYTGKTSAWARKAFDANLAALASAPEGQRNVTLWDVSRRLGQLVGGGELDSAEVVPALLAIAETWPNISHSRDTIRRAFEAGCANPRSAPPPRGVVSIDDEILRATGGL